MVNHSYGWRAASKQSPCFNSTLFPPSSCQVVAELRHCLVFPRAAAPSPPPPDGQRRSCRAPFVWIWMPDLTRRSTRTSTTRQIATGGGEKDRGPTRRRALLIHHDPGSDLGPLSGLCFRKRRAANKNTPQLERKIKLHSSARDPPPSFRAKHFAAFAPTTGALLGGSGSRASAWSHVPTLKPSPQQLRGSTYP